MKYDGNARYRSDPAFRAAEIARAKRYLERADPLRRRRIYLSKEIYQLGEYIAAKRLRIKEMEAKLAELKAERESIKWQIYQQRKR